MLIINPGRAGPHPPLTLLGPTARLLLLPLEISRFLEISVVRTVVPNLFCLKGATNFFYIPTLFSLLFFSSFPSRAARKPAFCGVGLANSIILFASMERTKGRKIRKTIVCFRWSVLLESAAGPCQTVTIS